MRCSFTLGTSIEYDGKLQILHVALFENAMDRSPAYFEHLFRGDLAIAVSKECWREQSDRSDDFDIS